MTKLLPILILLATGPTATARPAPPSGADPASAEPAVALVEEGLSCACYEDGELGIEADRTLADPGCTCDFARAVRQDLVRSVRGMPAATPADRERIAVALENRFLTESPEYERLLRYDEKRYRWFLENVRCGCGCSAMSIGACQLDCPVAVVYKRRTRVFLALGFETDEVLAHYIDEHNATHAAREQIDRAWALHIGAATRGWGVPALAILTALLLLGLGLRRIVRRTAEAEPERAPPGGGAGPEAEESLSEAERARILDALDDLPD